MAAGAIRCSRWGASIVMDVLGRQKVRWEQQRVCVDPVAVTHCYGGARFGYREKRASAGRASDSEKNSRCLKIYSNSRATFTFTFCAKVDSARHPICRRASCLASARSSMSRIAPPNFLLGLLVSSHLLRVHPFSHSFLATGLNSSMAIAYYSPTPNILPKAC